MGKRIGVIPVLGSTGRPVGGVRVGGGLEVAPVLGGTGVRGGLEVNPVLGSTVGSKWDGSGVRGGLEGAQYWAVLGIKWDGSGLGGDWRESSTGQYWVGTGMGQGGGTEEVGPVVGGGECQYWTVLVERDGVTSKRAVLGSTAGEGAQNGA